MAFLEARLCERFEKGARGGHTFATTIIETAGGAESRNVDWETGRFRATLDVSALRPGDYEALQAAFTAARGRAYPFRFKWWNDYKVTRRLQLPAALGGTLVTLPSLLMVGDGATTTTQLRKVYEHLLAGQAQAGGAATITLAATHNEWPDHAVDDTYNTKTIHIVAGTGAGQTRIVLDYVGATKVLTVSSNWTTQPDATSIYAIALYSYPRAIYKPVPGSGWVIKANETTLTATINYKTGAVTGLTGTPASNTAVIATAGEFDEPVRFDVDEEDTVYDTINSRRREGVRLIGVRDYT